MNSGGHQVRIEAQGQLKRVMDGLRDRGMPQSNQWLDWIPYQIPSLEKSKVVLVLLLDGNARVDHSFKGYMWRSSGGHQVGIETEGHFKRRMEGWRKGWRDGGMPEPCHWEN